jgi:outer membrane protein TolC
MQKDNTSRFRSSVRTAPLFRSILWLIPLLLASGDGRAQESLPAGRPDVSGSLTMRQAVEIGLKESLLLRAVREEAGAASAETRAARSQTRPQVYASAYLSAGDMDRILSGAPDGMPTGSQMVPPKGYAAQSLSLMVPLYTGGRLQNRVRAAAAREQAAVTDIREMQAEVALQIREAYLRALLADELAKAAQARLDAAQALLETTRAQAEAGKTIEAAMLRVQAEVASAQQERTMARNDREKALLELKNAMGIRLDSQITLTDTMTFSTPQGDLNGSLAQALRSRPEILAARSRLQAARAQTEAARGSLQPQVYAAVMADAFASQEMKGGTGYTVGITLNLPLFDGGMRRAEIAGARAMQTRAEAQLREAEQRVALQVRQAWLDMETAAQNYRTAQAGVRAAESSYEVIALRVANQKSILVEQLDALAALTQARAALAQAVFDSSMANARLLRAQGQTQ